MKKMLDEMIDKFDSRRSNVNQMKIEYKKNVYFETIEKFDLREQTYIKWKISRSCLLKAQIMKNVLLLN